jgi:hypothetical protein
MSEQNRRASDSPESREKQGEIDKEIVKDGLGQPSISLDENWLETFYKECGREATLAYTTLNQMKNWAMIVAAAAISGLSFGTSAALYPNVPMFLGVVLVYVFVLRFYVRAILCYINLLRWNQLQSDCVSLKLVQKPPRLGESKKTKEDLEKQLIQDIENYYHRWLSTVNRKTQLFSNLKLGFALLFALPLFFMVQGVATLWGNSWVKGMTFFALGTTFVELNDFFKSQFFDDVRAFKKRESRGKFHDIFPAPASRGWYIALWLLNLTISIAIAQWPKVAPILCKFLQGFYR